MADIRKSVAENVAGDFFVDSTCIDCDACRQLGPEVFGDAGGFSFVHAQPPDEVSSRRALHALIACPTASIGARAKHDVRAAISDFPMHLDVGVFYCGFHSEKSYGGASYLVQHRDGNWLIDSPRFTEPLVRRIADIGGIARIFLTHRDDVADAARWAKRFGAQRIIHRDELHAQPDAEIVLDGQDPILLGSDFLVIPTPGHTRGHCCLFYSPTTDDGRRTAPRATTNDQRPTIFLFTGDHLWWDRETKSLGAGPEVCWWSWPEQMKSLGRLLDYQFDWVLPGHGARIHLTAAELHASLQALVERQ